MRITNPTKISTLTNHRRCLAMMQALRKLAHKDVAENARPEPPRNNESAENGDGFR